MRILLPTPAHCRPIQAVPICVHQISFYAESLPCPPNAPQPAKWWWSVCLPCPDTTSSSQPPANPGKGWPIDQSQSGIRPRDSCRPMRGEKRTREQLSSNPFCGLREKSGFLSAHVLWSLGGNRDGWIQSFWKMKRSLQLLVCPH